MVGFEVGNSLYVPRTGKIIWGCYDYDDSFVWIPAGALYIFLYLTSQLALYFVILLGSW
ncbi:hypothetical protein BDV26DRAFT_260877 [Aspergillus bertholletiae]|uniref:Uncharacterized protein n=1 Tax=Aspergillus bertholletiae TaxID=1226010 RepID=A0A5N7BAI6_9EURO|nr:hypothetical protein BDV26DRAFT_260877 [Aspergillus bertholletiae]